MTIKEAKVISTIKDTLQEILQESQAESPDNVKIMAKAMSVLTLCDVIEPETEKATSFNPYCGSPKPRNKTMYQDDAPDFGAANKEQHSQ